MDEQNQQPTDPEQPADRTPTPEPEPAAPVPSPAQPLAAPPRPPQNTDSLIIWGFILAALGLVCCCCGQIFSVAAIVLGAIAYGRGDQRGMWVMIAGAVSFLISSGIGATYMLVPQMWPHQFRPHDWMNGPWHVT